MLVFESRTTQQLLKEVAEYLRLRGLQRGVAYHPQYRASKGEKNHARAQEDALRLVAGELDAATVERGGQSRPSPANLPPDPENMNVPRADSADRALDFFAEDYGELYPTENDAERRDLMAQNLSDLFANFAHLCDREGLELSHLLHRAANHYNEETDNQGLQKFEAHQ